MTEIKVLSRTQKIIVNPDRSVSVINAGPPGPTGAKGDPGTAASNFIFQQVAPANPWMIAHNLHKRPSVIVVDDTGVQILADVQFVNNDNIQIYFSTPTVGAAYMN